MFTDTDVAIVGAGPAGAWAAYSVARRGARVTIFDASRVIDRSTYREPSLPPAGIQYVLVNGIPVVSNGHPVEGVNPGQPVRAPISLR